MAQRVGASGEGSLLSMDDYSRKCEIFPFATSVKIEVGVIWACQNTSMFLQNRLFQTKIKLFQCANLFPLRNEYGYFS